MSKRARDRVHSWRLIYTVRKAVCLLSGGLDSATVLGYALSKGLEVHALSFNYGQRHARELDSSNRVAEHYGVDHKIIDVNLTQIGGSSLTDDIPVATRNIEEIENGIPTSYVPARNTIFLALAAGYLETIGGDTVYIGVNAVDYSGYPDCRPDFISAMENALNLGTGDGKKKWLAIEAPLQYLSKSEIIKMGHDLAVPYELTSSCYNGNEEACGKCDSCLLRLRGFMDAGHPDPIKYRELPDFYADFLKKING